MQRLFRWPSLPDYTCDFVQLLRAMIRVYRHWYPQITGTPTGICSSTVGAVYRWQFGVKYFYTAQPVSGEEMLKSG